MRKRREKGRKRMRRKDVVGLKKSLKGEAESGGQEAKPFQFDNSKSQ